MLGLNLFNDGTRADAAREQVESFDTRNEAQEKPTDGPNQHQSGGQGHQYTREGTVYQTLKARLAEGRQQIIELRRQIRIVSNEVAGAAHRGHSFRATLHPRMLAGCAMKWRDASHLVWHSGL
jgi:hypothetical protein